MRITIRGVSVIFSTVFSDEDGVATTPDSATLTISYPSDDWPLDGNDRVTETIDLANTVEAPTVWEGTWDSQISNPGIIFWHARALTGSTYTAQEDGFYRLRGNLANLTFVNA